MKTLGLNFYLMNVSFYMEEITPLGKPLDPGGLYVSSSIVTTFPSWGNIMMQIMDEVMDLMVYMKLFPNIML